jgi:prepilin-type N-terminal cleavage/methylation domain-containing protein
MIFFKEKNHGFTLIELMIAMVIGLIIMASIYQVFRSYQQAQATQQLVVDMLQNARAAMTLMKREIRMAGYAPAAKDGIDNDGDGDIDNADPSEIGPGFVKAQRDLINFTMDILPDNPAHCSDGVDNDSDGLIDELDECYDGDTNDANENITYDLSGATLRRITSDGTADLAYDIEAVAFAYAYDADFNGLPDTDTGAIDGNVVWAYDSNGDLNLDLDIATGGNPPGGAVSMTTAGGRSIIGAVKIWLLARTANPLPNYSDTHTYQLADQTIGPGTYDPRYKRTLLTATVYCRNLRF